ncbi:MAG: hypothetical protein H6677_15340 [Candidatus Obscuribacterales bacterium]|nr:hypothetical protein [Cyanobacteria bacterium HKST-UBA01]MCB9469640.1 hypothetical protein [Candidatus Obscuribacterales bacterium]
MFKLLVVLLSSGTKRPGAARLMVLGLIGTTFIAAMRIKARHFNFGLYRTNRSK